MSLDDAIITLILLEDILFLGKTDPCVDRKNKSFSGVLFESRENLTLKCAWGGGIRCEEEGGAESRGFLKDGYPV